MECCTGAFIYRIRFEVPTDGVSIADARASRDSNYQTETSIEQPDRDLIALFKEA